MKQEIYKYYKSVLDETHLADAHAHLAPEAEWHSGPTFSYTAYLT